MIAKTTVFLLVAFSSRISSLTCGGKDNPNTHVAYGKECGDSLCPSGLPPMPCNDQPKEFCQCDAGSCRLSPATGSPCTKLAPTTTPTCGGSDAPNSHLAPGNTCLNDICPGGRALICPLYNTTVCRCDPGYCREYSDGPCSQKIPICGNKENPNTHVNFGKECGDSLCPSGLPPMPCTDEPKYFCQCDYGSCRMSPATGSPCTKTPPTTTPTCDTAKDPNSYPALGNTCLNDICPDGRALICPLYNTTVCRCDPGWCREYSDGPCSQQIPICGGTGKTHTHVTFGRECGDSLCAGVAAPTCTDQPKYFCQCNYGFCRNSTAAGTQCTRIATTSG